MLNAYKQTTWLYVVKAEYCYPNMPLQILRFVCFNDALKKLQEFQKNPQIVSITLRSELVREQTEPDLFNS